ncbi:MAG: hypothetical protein IPJ88_05065 [Myxococcales bacterium]|nr:MAG: hypothetical protein IPJ88_05065 [Myxococcales bacterium]
MRHRFSFSLISLLLTLCIHCGSEQTKDVDAKQDAVIGGRGPKTDCLYYDWEAYDPILKTRGLAKNIANCLVSYARDYSDDIQCGVEALARLFDHPTLSRWLRFVGDTPESRLDFVLDITAGRPGWDIPGVHYAIEFGTDDIAEAFNDTWLYDDLWDAGGADFAYRQIGHFLTGVHFAFDPSLAKNLALRTLLPIPNNEDPETTVLRLMVGHEKIPDPGDVSFAQKIGSYIEQYKSASAEDIEAFERALDYDTENQGSERDTELLKILASAGYTSEECNRIDCATDPCLCDWKHGNSLEDLRLDIKAYRFVRELSLFSDTQEAADWIREELGDSTSPCLQ